MNWDQPVSGRDYAFDNTIQSSVDQSLASRRQQSDNEDTGFVQEDAARNEIAMPILVSAGLIGAQNPVAIDHAQSSERVDKIETHRRLVCRARNVLLNMQQLDFAKCVGCSASAISLWLNDKMDMQSARFDRISSQVNAFLHQPEPLKGELGTCTDHANYSERVPDVPEPLSPHLSQWSQLTVTATAKPAVQLSRAGTDGNGCSQVAIVANHQKGADAMSCENSAVFANRTVYLDHNALLVQMKEVMNQSSISNRDFACTIEVLLPDLNDWLRGNHLLLQTQHTMDRKIAKWLSHNQIAAADEESLIKSVEPSSEPSHNLRRQTGYAEAVSVKCAEAVNTKEREERHDVKLAARMPQAVQAEMKCQRTAGCPKENKHPGRCKKNSSMMTNGCDSRSENTEIVQYVEHNDQCENAVEQETVLLCERTVGCQRENKHCGHCTVKQSTSVKMLEQHAQPVNHDPSLQMPHCELLDLRATQAMSDGSLITLSDHFEVNDPVAVEWGKKHFSLFDAVLLSVISDPNRQRFKVQFTASQTIAVVTSQRIHALPTAQVQSIPDCFIPGCHVLLKDNDEIEANWQSGSVLTVKQKVEHSGHSGLQFCVLLSNSDTKLWCALHELTSCDLYECEKKGCSYEHRDKHQVERHEKMCGLDKHSALVVEAREFLHAKQMTQATLAGLASSLHSSL